MKEFLKDDILLRASRKLRAIDRIRNNVHSHLDEIVVVWLFCEFTRYTDHWQPSQYNDDSYIADD